MVITAEARGGSTSARRELTWSSVAPARRWRPSRAASARSRLAVEAGLLAGGEARRCGRPGGAPPLSACSEESALAAVRLQDRRQSCGPILSASPRCERHARLQRGGACALVLPRIPFRAIRVVGRLELRVVWPARQGRSRGRVHAAWGNARLARSQIQSRLASDQSPCVPWRCHRVI